MVTAKDKVSRPQVLAMEDGASRPQVIAPEDQGHDHCHGHDLGLKATTFAKSGVETEKKENKIKDCSPKLDPKAATRTIGACCTRGDKAGWPQVLAPEENAGRPHVLAPEDKVGRQEVLAQEEEDGRHEVFASEDEVGRPELLIPEYEASWPKMLTLEEEVVAPDVLADEARRPEVFTQTKC